MTSATLTGTAAPAAWTPTVAEKLTARLDRLPMTRTIWVMALLLSLGGFFDGYAIGLIGAVAPGLFHAKIMTATTVSFFGMTGFASYIASFFAGLFVAALFGAYVADRFGRRVIFAIALLWFGITNFIMGFQTTADGLDIWRFISALGVGLELVTVDAYLSELVPKRARGKAFGFLLGITGVSGPVIYIISSRLAPPVTLLGQDGWRWVVWIGSVAAIVVWWIRLGLPESPRWLAQQGRVEEAEKVMAHMEARAEAESGRPLQAPDPPHYQDPREGNWTEVFEPRYRTRTIMLMLFNFFQTVGYYGFFAWIPTLLIKKGIHVTQSLEYTAIIMVAQTAFPFIVMSFADRMERKWQVCTSCFLIAVFGMWFSALTNAVGLIILGAALAASTQWMAYGLHNYQSELYPTRIRARAVGFVYSWSRIAGVVTPFFVAYFLKVGGVPGVFAFVAASLAVVIVSVAAMGPRTLNLELEAIAH